MATVYIGGASIDENGKAHGGKAGNQTGKELRKQKWYKHAKGWRVFRARSAEAAERIAACAEAAVANLHIGYDQYERNTLYNEAAKFGFDVSRVTQDVECDCSALVRVCCAYAGIMGLPEGFRTSNEPKNLLASGAFVEMVGAKYTDASACLKRGDILCTATQGHTVVVLNDGPRSEASAPVPGDGGLSKGDCGAAVEELQRSLVARGYDLGDYGPKRDGVDGDFGTKTEEAVKAFQQAAGLPATGAYDEATRAALIGPAQRQIEVTGGTVNVRNAPGSAGTRVLGVVHKGERLPYQGETRMVGDRAWYLAEFLGANGWVSSLYARLV